MSLRYYDQLGKQVEASGTVVIKGIILDVGADHPLRSKGYFPILSPTCVCVTDPCPCDDDDGPIVWLPDSGVRERKPTELKGRNGEALHEFHVNRDADIITESFTRTKAASFNARGRTTSQAYGRSGHSRAPLGAYPQPCGWRGSVARIVECGGNGVLYEVHQGPDGSGGTLFEYIPIGSCNPVMS